ncbi:MAG TPA: hypothetical protein PLM56_00970 [Cyclobacteriaceae bacterium]|jgi:uncharacterized integral membrane protein|nr:hypothetical protein [Cytophagales bacterium]HNT51305.1 hypothetical protein [Cyclobacteriaceae bacterium]HRE66427.1 hypothetical protein [Cyclobacteriaceae bacterium]HRF32040.1 hypothetical protein [Cyclobacteriaceae bacterium]
MEFWITVIGWVGSVAVIVAYGLNSMQKLKSNSLAFQVLNLSGAILLIINSVFKEAYPFTFINTVWAIIAIVAIFKIVRKLSTTQA